MNKTWARVKRDADDLLERFSGYLGGGLYPPSLRAEHSAPGLSETIEVLGRGGTDLRHGFAWLEEQGIRPAGGS